MISYAQNFEDVILFRALKHIDAGFYIDIGAQDPRIDSVSLSFYELGWRGVHVEPVASYAKMLKEARPEDDVLAVAVGPSREPIEFYEIAGTGISTGDVAVAMRHARSGHQVRLTEVTCVSLGDVLDKYKDREVHWLKIDVEGMERQVLESWTPSEVRPWIVLVESTAPTTAEQTHRAWEPLLTQLGYKFVHFDGLNRFFVSGSHPELLEKFETGPNIFDGFLLAPDHPLAGLAHRQTEEAQRQVQTLTTELNQQAAANALEQRRLKDELDAREAVRLKAIAAAADALNGDLQQKSHDLLASRANAARIDQLHQETVQKHLGEIASLNAQILALYGSTSWRTTSPVRALKISSQNIVRSGLEKLLIVHRRIPRLASAVRMAVALAPPLNRRLRAFATVRTPAFAMPQPPPTWSHNIVFENESLASPVLKRAEQIYNALKAQT